jgi:hypothetical protein
MENISRFPRFLHLIPRRIWQLLPLMGILLLILVLMVGCNSNSIVTTTTEVTSTTVVPSSTEKPRTVSYFPVQKEDPKIIMLALWHGKLEIDDQGYLRVGGNLILWPYGYSYKVEGEDILIIDERGNSAAHVGEDIKGGGGEIPEWIVDEKLVQPLPQKNIGPYFLANHFNEYPPDSTTTQ